MALRFHPLPVTLFPRELQGAIGRMNRELTDLFGLEGTLSTPSGTRRSDLSISRRGEQNVEADRIINLVQVSGGSGSGTTAHNLLSATHADVVSSTPVRGGIIVANSTPKWEQLARGSTSDKQLLQSGSAGDPAWATITYEKGICVESPTASEDLTIWHTPEKVEVTEIRGVLQGGSVTTITVDVKWDSDRSAAGTSLLDNVYNVTGTTTGQAMTLGSTTSNLQIPAGSYVWMESSAGGGTGTLHLSTKFKRVA